MRELVDAHAQKGELCTPVELRSWWNVLGKLARQPDERRVLQGTPGILHPLAADTEQALPEFDGRSLATTVNGLANLHASRCWWASDALWTGLATHCTARAPTMSAMDVANTVHGFAKVGRREPALLDAIAKEAVRRGLREFNPQDLANTVWAYATADYAAPALLDAIAN